MEKKVRELTEKELFDVCGGAEHIQTEDGLGMGTGTVIIIDPRPPQNILEFLV